MRPISRPAHWRLTRLEQEQIDADHQRGVERGYLGGLLVIVSPVIAIAIGQVVNAIRGL